MLALAFLVVGGLVVWTLAAPGLQFLPALSRLLTGPRIRQRALDFISGRCYLDGDYQNRAVACSLQLKRTRYGQGYLVVAVRTHGPANLDYNAIETQPKDHAGRRALFTLAKHDLRLSVEDGWLKALWRPQGLMIFPGRFSEEKWRQVLDAMVVVATSLDARA